MFSQAVFDVEESHVNENRLAVK